MNAPNPSYPMHVGIVVTSQDQLQDVYALLGGNVSLAAAAVGTSPSPSDGGSPKSSTATPAPTASESEPVSTGDVELDAHGHPWSEDLHASTKGKTKDGLWRLKPGASRPDPVPVYPKEDEGDDAAEAEAEAAAEEATAKTAEEDDEFAAFREAAAEDEETEAAPRSWTEADISKLCNQAAVKLGDPGPIKNIIAKFVPEGETPHSRNIPDDQREAFAQEVESKAGIEFDG